MLKLYKLGPQEKLYWETWEADDGGHVVHYGELGTKGATKHLPGANAGAGGPTLREEVKQALEQGYKEISLDKHEVALIEFRIDGMGTNEDLEKRYRLQDRMDETLGWTGLGHCDGGSIGSGTMEVCCIVVDFELAQAVIAADLEGTEFGDFHRIYREGETGL